MKFELVAVCATMVFAAGCGCGDPIKVNCTTDTECGAGATCQSGKCVGGNGGGSGSNGGGTSSSGGGTSSSGGGNIATGCDPNATDNATRDTDCDGLTDADEYNTPYPGMKKTDPCNSDSDGDGLTDGVELGRTTTVNASCGAKFVADTDPGSRTNPTSDDTDGDGLKDGAEDKDHNGRLDPGESSPALKDTDCDGVSDGDEVGGTLGCKTDPAKIDSDGDGIPDGVEEGVQPPGADNAVCKYPAKFFDSDPAVKTDACNPDSDGDGIPDGAEDSNQNGKVDPGELNPKDAADATPVVKAACSTANLKPIDLRANGIADVQIALTTDFAEITAINDGNGQRGVMFYSDATKVAGFVITRPPAGASSTNDEQFVRGKLQGAVTAPTNQSFTTWDNFAGSTRSSYDLDGAVDLKTRINDIAKALTTAGATGLLSGMAGVTGPFKVQAEYVRRTNTRSAIVVAITPAAGYAGARLFALDDTAGGSALAQFGDYTAPTCEVFDSTINAKVDFVWMVDDSGSMANAQNAVNNAGSVFGDKLAAAGLDWRAGAVTTGYFSLSSSFRDFTSDLATMKSWFNKANPSPPWFGTSGSSSERPFQSAQAYFPNLLPRSATVVANKFRDGAAIHGIVLSDTDDQSTATIAALTTYFNNVDGAGGKAVIHAIVCPEGIGTCGDSSVPNPGRTAQIVRATGGVEGDIRLANDPSATAQQQLANTLDKILSAAIAGTGHQLVKPPIAASIKIAMEAGSTKGACNVNDVPRDRTNGFDYDSASRRISFFGNCIPNAAGKKIAVSYKFWNDASPDPNGDPCGGACSGAKVCEPSSKSCVCQTNCGGTCSAGLSCDMASCTCGPGIG